MNILRKSTRWLCALGISIALSLWIVIATAQATVLNRTTVEGWLQQSGIYSKNLNDYLQVTPGSQTAADPISNAALQKAFAKTFPPSYIQQTTETVINATYDWLDGAQPAVRFNIPVQNKASEFMTNLAGIITPELQALPPCPRGATAAAGITCLPAGVSAADYAKQLTQLSNNGDFLHAPLTEQSLQQQGEVPQMDWLPQLVQTARSLFYILPVTIALLGTAYVFLSEDRLRGLQAVGRQLTINTAITLIGGLFVWFASSSIDLSSAVDTAANPQGAALASSYINPLARTILPSIGMYLSLFSGIVVAIGLALWVGIAVWRKQHSGEGPGTPQTPNIPAPTPHETHLPPPTSAPRPQQ